MAFLIVCACIGIVVTFWLMEVQEDLDRQQRIRREIEWRRKNDAARTAYKASPEGIDADTVRERNRAERRRPKFYMTPDGLKQFGGDDI
jgi:hypothetical protein